MNEQLSNTQLLSVAKNFGTPTYVYNANQIKYRYQQLVTAFAQSNVKIFYACKALTNIHILKYFKNLGSNIDCSSINEAKLALYAGFEPQQVLYTSNGIAFSEIEKAKNLGIHINIDSISNLEKFGKTYQHSYPVGIRLRPNIMAGGNLKISTGHGKSKFGIPIEQLPEVLAIVKQYNMHIKHLHIHTGSEICDVSVFVKGIEVLLDIVPFFEELEVLDLGGGFKVKYEASDKETNIEMLANEITKTFNNHYNVQNKSLQIWFEPGKFLVSECGYLLTQVNVIKPTPDICFAQINSGFNHLIRPMFYDAYHHIENISNPNGSLQTYTITGNICETDNFATDRDLPQIKEYDYLVFYNAGAYGFEMSSNFNSRYKPAEVFIENNTEKLIRKREEWNDLLKGQIDID